MILWSWIPKTAGTSIHNRLSGSGRPCERDALIGCTEYPSRVAVFSHGHWPFRDLLKKKWRTRKELDASLSFVFVRNPWDRFVSIYYKYHLRHNGFGDFVASFLLDPQRTTPMRKYPGHYFGRPQMDWTHYADGQQAVRLILRYEHLDNDWERVCEMTGMNYAPLSRVNVTKMKRPYRDYYETDTREKIRRFYQSDIDAFQYEF